MPRYVNFTRFLVAHLLTLLWIATTCPSAVAHHGLGPTTAKSFFKPESGEAHLLVRVPLAALETVGFSLTEREIDLAKAGPAIQSALNELRGGVTIEEDGRTLVPVQAIGRLSLPSDRSFDSYEEAIRHVSEPMPPGLTIYAEQGFLDAHFTYPIRSQQARFSIRTRAFPELGDYLTLAVRFIPADGVSRIVTLTSRSATVRLNPTWYEAAIDFAIRGGIFVASNIECLLLLTCFLVPARPPRQLWGMVLAFSVANCLTLLVFASDAASASTWLPLFVLAGVTASVVCMALISIISPQSRGSLLVSLLSGLLFGLLFALAFKDSLQFAGDHTLTALLAFVVGIETGQLLALVALLPVVAFLLRYVFVGRAGTYVVLALIALIAWPWMLERAEVLTRTPWPMVELRALAPWLFGVLVVASALRLLLSRRRRVRERPVAVGEA